MKSEDGIRIAKALRQRLLERGLPIRAIYLYGSVARNEARKDSDIDVAIVCEPFLPSRHKENVEFLLLSKDIDLGIETVALHPDDFDDKFCTIAQEVKKYGIPV